MTWPARNQISPPDEKCWGNFLERDAGIASDRIFRVTAKRAVVQVKSLTARY
jgi:hypothetical protein